jgi:hypothetical protein
LLIAKSEYDIPEKLPFRKVIEVLVDIPYETLERVSPESRLLKEYIKVPMVLSALTAALFASLYTVTIKLTGQIIASGGFKEDWAWCLIILSISVMFGLLSVYKLTQCQMFYQMLECQTVFQGSNMIA